jgi:large subunit ribosomal protein L5
MSENRLKARYKSDIKPALAKELDIKNPMNIPALEKIVISVGAGEEAKDKKILQNVVDTISLIAGQKAVVTNTKRAVANFKTRVGYPIGVKVTLRQEKMFAFLDKLISVTLPRVKDFRGLSTKGFDGRGSYNFGLDEQLVFPEVKYDDIIKTHGMNITIVTTSSSDKEAYKLLELIGIPFKKGGK